jgi:hypothetical protein
MARIVISRQSLWIVNILIVAAEIDAFGMGEGRI